MPLATPVIVQGKPVNEPTPAVVAVPTAAAAAAAARGGGGGERQETKCRDPLFAILFYLTVAGILVTASTLGPGAVQEGQQQQQQESSSSAAAAGNSIVAVEYQGYLFVTLVTAALSLVASSLSLAVLMKFPETLIKMALIFTVILSGLMLMGAILSGQTFAMILGGVFFAITLCYARAVWSRIPFATANMVTAITAVKAHLGGVSTCAYLLTIAAALWSITWSVAFIGVFDQTYGCSDETMTCDDPSYGLLFILFVAFYFVQQVLTSCVHVTVAGTVGHWWFEGAGGGWATVGASFVRTCTTSFGSICFGSLIVAILEALKNLISVVREQDDGIGYCIAECLLSCIAGLVEYFNKWAFIYVGLYGYPYLEAGKNVFTLFRNRGWEAIIADDLVGNTLLLVSVLTGGVMGCVALVLAVVTSWLDDGAGNEMAVAFILGAVVGMVICSVLMSTIGSAVNAVIVLFAEAPAEFAANHPELSNRMLAVWRQTYPGSV